MRMDLLDRSLYYKGLLLLSGRDRIIDPRERELMLRFGKILDFEKRFCEAAMDDLLNNKYLKADPVIFSDREIAECFLHDALRLAFVDEELHPKELAWLKAIASANGFTGQWLDAEVNGLREKKGQPDPSSPFSIEAYLLESRH
jgi:hypothetical protein